MKAIGIMQWVGCFYTHLKHWIFSTISYEMLMSKNWKGIFCLKFCVSSEKICEMCLASIGNLFELKLFPGQIPAQWIRLSTQPTDIMYSHCGTCSSSMNQNFPKQHNLFSKRPLWSHWVRIPFPLSSCTKSALTVWCTAFDFRCFRPAIQICFWLHMLQISDSDLQDLHCKTLVVPSAWECHANGKQGDLSKLQVQVLNGKVPLE
jgi:hypothetical protein